MRNKNYIVTDLKTNEKYIGYRYGMPIVGYGFILLDLKYNKVVLQTKNVLISFNNTFETIDKEDLIEEI